MEHQNELWENGVFQFVRKHKYFRAKDFAEMKCDPIVSVIIIFLNTEKFIQEAIESVIKQSYGNWELFLVDDGSWDNSTQIAKRFADCYPQKIRYLEHDGHQNLGMSASRNLGIRAAKGEFVAFLDSDDVWLPQNLEKQVEVLLSKPEASMVYGPALFWYSWTGNPGDINRDVLQNLFDIKPGTLYKPPTFLRKFLQNNNTPSMCSILVRRKVIECIGYFEDKFRGLYEDQVFFAKISIEAPIYVYNECWAKYRRHAGSICMVVGNSEGYHSARLIFLEWLQGYLLKKRIMDIKIWAILKKELLFYHHPKLHPLLSYKNGTSYIRKKVPKPVKGVLKKCLAVEKIIRVKLRMIFGTQTLR